MSAVELLRWRVEDGQVFASGPDGDEYEITVRPAPGTLQSDAAVRAVARHLAGAATAHRVLPEPSLPEDLTPALRETCAALAWFWQTNGHAPSVSRLAKILGVAPPTVQLRLDNLEHKHHVIERTPGEHASVRLVPAAAEWASPA